MPAGLIAAGWHEDGALRCADLGLFLVLTLIVIGGVPSRASADAECRIYGPEIRGAERNSARYASRIPQGCLPIGAALDRRPTPGLTADPDARTVDGLPRSAVTGERSPSFVGSVAPRLQIVPPERPAGLP